MSEQNSIDLQKENAELKRQVAGLKFFLETILNQTLIPGDATAMAMKWETIKFQAQQLLEKLDS